MAYPTLKVANYFVARAIESTGWIHPLKLQRLVYIAQGWSLVLLAEPLLHESILAGPNGPLILGLDSFLQRRFGDAEVREMIGSPGDHSIHFIFETAAGQVLARTWEQYRDFTGIQLANLTHLEGSPWSEARKSAVEGEITVIDHEIMKRHYRLLAGLAA